AIAASSLGAATVAPTCVPDVMNATARLPGTTLVVTPAPGARDAMPQTQVSLLGAPVHEIASLEVRGSVSGLHSGRLESYSQHDGGSFVPDTPFVAGESVTITGSVTADGRATPFAYGFTIGEPDPIDKLPEHGISKGRPGTVLHFASATQITPSALTVTVDSAAARRDGDIFLAAYPGPGRTGPTIFDPSGQLVWFKPLPLGTFATNVRVQRYAGHPVLTWWQGLVSIHGFGLGEGEIYSTSYQRVATIHAGDGLQEDLHELQLAPNGSALITTWKPLFCDLASVGGPAYSAVYDAAFQEIDVRTGLVRYEWDSIEHLPLSDSYMPASGAKVSWPYDWFHLNSIALEPDGHILISARATWALYEIDPATGQVEWELGGRAPSFTMGPGTATAWQHDARVLGPDTFSAFDNGGPPSSLQHSHGIVLRLDPQTHTVSLVDRIAIPTPIFSETQGDLELLPDGNWWLGWGNVNESSEVSPSGKLLFEAHTPDGSQSYRSLRFPWSARPHTHPQTAILPGSRLAVSWNGATDVASWQLDAGDTSSTMRPVSTTARAGFQTTLTIPAGAKYVRVVAISTSGKQLAYSAIARAN
ncbi:MAG: arylsulfotransferase family protein, partial [Solirubrobacteraceae bacterium]